MAKNTAPSVTRLSEHLKRRGLTLSEFATQEALPLERLDDAAQDDCETLLIDGNVYIQATCYEAKWVLPKQPVPQRFSDYIEQHHQGDPDAFIAEFGENALFVEHAMQDGYYWLNGDAFEPLISTTTWHAIPLKEHINDVANGNAAAFSRAYGITQQQMHRWLMRDCLFCQGEIYLKRTEIENREPQAAEVILLCDHIRDTYGHGDEGIRLFSAQHEFVPQQVKRYLSYDSLWILGDVYKNQSKFKEQGIVPNFDIAFKPRKASPSGKKKR